KIHTIPRGAVFFMGFSFSKKGERGRNLLRGREALPAQQENRFSAPSGIGFVDGRQSRYGKSPDDSPHASPAIRIVN
uniref:hypothetical protein n=1 Tax=Klebsiella pneumoniae TaxID=573 RepID=UPI001F4BB968